MEEYRSTGLDDAMIRSLRRSFAGLANLYGAISIRDAYRVLRGAMKKKAPTQEQFRAFVRVARHDRLYRILRDSEAFRGLDGTPEGRQLWIVNFVLLTNDDSNLYAVLREDQLDKPLYQPSLSELHRYASTTYIMPTPQLDALAETLRELTGQSAEYIRGVISIMHDLAVFFPDEDWGTTGFRVFSEEGFFYLSRLSSDEKELLVQQIRNLCMVTPRWGDRGSPPAVIVADASEHIPPENIIFDIPDSLREILLSSSADRKALREMIRSMGLHPNVEQGLLMRVDELEAAAGPDDEDEDDW